MGKMEVQPFERTSAGKASVRGFLHWPAKPSGNSLVLTHGAGSDCQSPLLLAVAMALCEFGVTVLRGNLPFRQRQPHGPPPRGSAEHDREGLWNAVEALREQVPGRSFLGGHSYGGRQGSMLAASQPGIIEGLLLLAFPLHPPRRPDQLRTAHFPSLRTPALFVHGTRDGFASIEELKAALRLIPAPTELLPITGAGHDLLTSRNRQELPMMVAEAFRRFLSDESVIHS